MSDSDLVKAAEEVSAVKRLIYVPPSTPRNQWRTYYINGHAIYAANIDLAFNIARKQLGPKTVLTCTGSKLGH